MNKTLIALLLLLSALINQSSAQRKMVERLLSKENDSTRKARLLIVPALGYTQETGLEYGLVSLVSFYAGADTTTRNSSLGALLALTTKNQSFLTIKPDVWTNKNRYHFAGDLKYRDFPFNFYGVGDKTRKADEERISQKLIKLSLDAEKQLRRGAYTGLTTSYENHEFEDEAAGGLDETATNIRDKDGGQVLFLGISQILDSRNTNVYSTSGSYLKFNFSYAPDIFGKPNFSGSLMKADFRTFKSYNPKTVLGFNLNYQTINGSSTPFYLLQQMGNDQVMRGYYSGRYRDRNLLAAQFELRYRLIQRIGFVGFGGAGTVYNSKFYLDRLKPSYGAGLRYFFDTARGQSLRIDYAFGEKRNGEKRQKGFYLAFGEAF